MNRPDFSFEAGRPAPVCGIDEVGRGPWAGPVLAAAVILDPSQMLEGLNDSKKLSAARREALAAAMQRRVPELADEIEAALPDLLVDLKALDEAARMAAAALNGAAIIATHPRYQYLARAYGLTIHSLSLYGQIYPPMLVFAKLVVSRGGKTLTDKTAENVCRAIKEALPSSMGR